MKPREASVGAKYKRILLKLSGEALMGEDAYGINRQTIEAIVQEIAAVARMGVEIGVVIGGGNIFRGVAPGAAGMDRATADYMGMLATVMNALALQDAMRRAGLASRVQSALNIEQVVDLGFVGEPREVDTTIINTISAAGMIPVIAPIARGRDGETYNINADTMAGAIASALGAARLFMLTDVPGVLDKEKNLLTDLTPASIEKLQQDGTISGGMIPKLETCIHAVEAGCEAAVVLDGRVPHAMLLEIFTPQGVGTLVTKG